ncbi:hypothetical protein HGB24_03525 [Candidatus Saccharibacteria bacterium]|nr:hypothetical protein [Candidatus Saccharibacteria bacterium]
MNKETQSTDTNPLDKVANYVRTPNRKRIIGAAATALIFVGLGSYELFGKAEDKVDAIAPQTPGQEQVLDSQPSALEQINTQEQVDVAETLPTVENLRLDPSLFNDPEELIRTYVSDRETAWLESGANAINVKEAYKQSGLFEDFAVKKAAELDKIFIESLVVKDYKSNPSLETLMSNFERSHSRALSLFLKTSNPENGDGDKSPYKETREYIEGSYKVINVVKNKDGQIQSMTIQFQHRQFYNEGENRAAKLVTDLSKMPSGKIYQATDTYTLEDGRIKLSDTTLAAE